MRSESQRRRVTRIIRQPVPHTDEPSHPVLNRFPRRRTTIDFNMEHARARTLNENLTWPLRPVFTSLNGDQSWLFSIPRPADDQHPRWYYHIVFEPWLNGPTSQFSSWLIWISLSTPPAVANAQAVEDVALQIEEAAAKLAQNNAVTARATTTGDEGAYIGPIDCILLFFQYLDHLHEPTLKLFDKRIPVVATVEAKERVDKMNHFHNTSVIAQKTDRITTWRSADIHPPGLPPWLTAVKLLGQHELNFMGMLIWTHHDDSGNEIHEAIFESPHGMHLGQESLEGFISSTPPVQNLAFLHGLKESWTVNWQTTLGAEGGLKIFRRIGGAKYWILTHHSKLNYGGLITGYLANDIPRKLEWALGREKSESNGKELKAPNQPLIENGGCFVLA